MKTAIRIILIITTCVAISACGGNGKKNFALKVNSNPLGAYALMQVKYKGDENPEWIFLGPTPVVIDKSISYKGATSVALKVIRPGFFEQVKTWSARDFAKEHGKQKTISWTPNMVQQ